jgi:hypothetical protein
MLAHVQLAISALVLLGFLSQISRTASPVQTPNEKQPSDITGEELFLIQVGVTGFEPATS